MAKRGGRAPHTSTHARLVHAGLGHPIKNMPRALRSAAPGASSAPGTMGGRLRSGRQVRSDFYTQQSIAVRAGFGGNPVVY